MSNAIAVQNKSEGLIQFIKFGVVGVINTGVDWVVFYILINYFLSNEHTIAKAIAFLAAMLNSYIWNTIWTFKKEYKQSTGKGGSSKSAVFGKFAVVSIVGWALNVFIFNLATKNLSLEIINSDLLPLVFASGAAILWNFLANKFWTYKK